MLEAGQVASAASGRNGGQCNNGLSHDFGGMVAARGVDVARAYYRDFSNVVTTIETIVREEGISGDFVRGGKVRLAAKPQHVAALESSVDMLRKDVDPDVTFLDRSAAWQEADSDHFHGGMLFPRSVSMHMGRFGRGLA